MQNLYVSFFLAVILVFGGGCSTIRDFLVDHNAPEKVADAVDSYCEEIPFDDRMLNRDAINAATSPGNVVSVRCAGDPAP